MDSVSNKSEQTTLSIIRDYLPLLSMMAAGLVWGMKLEGQLATMQERQRNLEIRFTRVEEQVSVGILPRAQEKFEAHEQYTRSLEMRLERLEQSVSINTKARRDAQ